VLNLGESDARNVEVLFYRTIEKKESDYLGTVPLDVVPAKGAAVTKLDCRLDSPATINPVSEIRLKGNAYGASLSYDALSGVLLLGSFRDPQIVRTLQVLAGTRDHVAQADWSQTDIDRAIIGVAKQDERPLRPGEATGEALNRFTTGQTAELRDRLHAARREATPGKVKRALLETLNAGMGRSVICVAAGREKLEEANRALGDQALTITDVSV